MTKCDCGTRYLGTECPVCGSVEVRRITADDDQDPDGFPVDAAREEEQRRCLAWVRWGILHGERLPAVDEGIESGEWPPEVSDG